MRTGTDDLFALVPRWYVELVAGVAVVAVAVAGLAAGGWVVRAVVLESVFGPVPRVNLSTVEGVGAFALAVVLLALVYGLLGLGVTDAYLTRREFTPGFVLEWPDEEATELLVGHAVLAPVAVGAGTAVARLTGRAGDVIVAGVPETYVFSWSLSAAPAVWPPSLAADAALHLLLLAGVVGPTAGVLYHGVIQSSVRRVAPAWVAAAVTAAAVVVTKALSVSGPISLLVVGAFAFAAGLAYDRTGNLAVPAVAYALLNGVTLAVAIVVVLTKWGGL